MRYSTQIGEPLHLSLFRRSLEARAKHLKGEVDPVHEYLIDQSNLRDFFGAFSARENLGALDPTLTPEEIVVGLLQPHAPVEPRVVKLVVRILQSAMLNTESLCFLARKERALPVVAWVVDLIPEAERTTSVLRLEKELKRRGPRSSRRPTIEYSSDRLLRPK